MVTLRRRGGVMGGGGKRGPLDYSAVEEDVIPKSEISK